MGIKVGGYSQILEQIKDMEKSTISKDVSTTLVTRSHSARLSKLHQPSEHDLPQSERSYQSSLVIDLAGPKSQYLSELMTSPSLFMERVLQDSFNSKIIQKIQQFSNFPSRQALRKMCQQAWDSVYFESEKMADSISSLSKTQIDTDDLEQDIQMMSIEIYKLKKANNSKKKLY